MLNRRTLRIKAMQTAFAYRQCKEANYANALENIRLEFLPDLNSMEPQDPALLAQQGKEAQGLFTTKVDTNEKFITGGSMEKINNVVKEEIGNYHKNNRKDHNFLRNQMLISSEKIYDYYLLNLLLLIEFADLAGKDQRPLQSNFAGNRIISKIRGNKEFNDLVIRRNISWKGEESNTRQWFRELVKTDEEYLNYNKQENVSFDKDQAIILHLIKKVLLGKDNIDVYWQDLDLQWHEDRAVILSMLKKTVKEISPENDSFDLQVLSYNWEDDKEFFEGLFEASIEAAEKYTELIANKSSNWDVERLAITDRIILEMAIAEMTGFPSIPVKVTINEYIEVSKRYSTPKSKQFINGMLDVLSKELIQQGVIKKSGRGLIDNK
jgi:N utilization substance protein B